MIYKRLKFTAYIGSFLVVFIPTLIVLMLDITIEPLISKIITSIAFILFIIGQTVKILEKKKNELDTAPDVGVLLGVLIAIVMTSIN